MTRIRSIVARISRATAGIARLLGRLTTNAAGHTTVAAYLRARGASDEWIARWGSAFGRRAAKAHRTATGTEPVTSWEFTTKGIKRHMAYPTTTHLDEAYIHYLGHKVAGPALPLALPEPDTCTPVVMTALQRRLSDHNHRAAEANADARNLVKILATEGTTQTLQLRAGCPLPDSDRAIRVEDYGSDTSLHVTTQRGRTLYLHHHTRILRDADTRRVWIEKPEYSGWASD